MGYPILILNAYGEKHNGLKKTLCFKGKELLYFCERIWMNLFATFVIVFQHLKLIRKQNNLPRNLR